ncbi:23S rRNA (uracil(1939)-C(5))-methyltransferase RlmD [Undibacterium sp. RTI2.1]|uniref:23S rRNA (uracil(1939)-C(5))-methyltransferase RlmD n=1 Tax=unclassified Undibacterium TaxID=2630295 RepID=UPI002AB581D2|nr:MULTISPECIES: 23S rRNA (uracil(1939)-C(5))-methyltransferase RlmD [unclassified Undibacterium]MDY7538047.1 23S rRNA (uracil(1939)-C(5))-methyltransferase RlmD [Undibacterium sp. 5I1]MEB0032550.1 23S rRNA (uracil(1939)-C(5))-methyltransferase RlmD [Undibacterium sp. RTI2.1]MEB0117889.1 23S rRNA (uracil(1939)-C(5))-methyltransferase RlmD [Undibacterium sp. RTI2.2]MEB0231666.1 23S rRNA (uracil(1939)-C(5))-methyltransferase RlmD [Undibacterium sp. 10I3]MEB0258677.1 23S rRNA (uracil(1939)-C(5))-
MNTINIRSFDMDARGVGHLENEDGTPGKVVFVEGALPGEVVGFSTFKKKATWEAANMTHLVRESSQRVKPKCEFFGVCGGCSMQHLESNAQVAMKQRVLEDNLWHISKVKAETMLRPIYGPTWGYRYRARLSVRNVHKKGIVLVGFHEKKSRYVANMETCEILPPHVSAMLMPLRDLISSLSIIEALPQIELAIGEDVTAMVLRIMEALTAEDEVKLKAFADQYQVQWWLQTKGPETATPFYPEQSELHYLLPEFGIKMPFKPTDFTQVNHHINRVLVERALRLLDVQKDERIADLFCGLGNFTLPIATLAKEVVGIEGSSTLTERAMENARANGLEATTSFGTRNLFEVTAQDFVALGKFDRFLVDPPRDGAMAVCQALIDLGSLAPELKPKRIVYVSCSPSTLARDAGMLVNQAGYRLSFAGVVNMFPHTSHVESMAVFDLD